MRQILLTILILGVFSCSSQIEDKQLSKKDENAYLKLIYSNCPKADILEIENAIDFIEIEYLCEGQLFEVGISNGEIIFQETKVEQSDIPFNKIEHKIEKKHQGWLLDEIMLVSTKDTSFLKVEIVKDGFEQNLFFTTTGKWYKSKSVLASTKWNVNNLSKNQTFQMADYKFLNPNNIYDLPDILNEISGIAIADTNTVLCIQDELGAVFKYNLSNEEIVKVYRFTDVGDFEDIAINGDFLFVLRSDGNVFDFNYKDYRVQVNQNMIPINSLNIEGLFYDTSTGYMYIVSKEALVNTKESKRMVFRYSIKATHLPELYLEININDLTDLFKKNFPEMANSNILFNPSAIAIHPITKEIYILSANERVLVIYNNNKLKNIYPLPAELYYKPEGISFFANGDILISSEGNKKGLIKGSILLLNYTP